MKSTTVLFTDVSSQAWIEETLLNTETHPDFSKESGWFIRKQQLHGGASEGVDLITVCNGALTLSIVPTRGMGVWKGDYQGTPLGWQSPVKSPVNPAFVNLSERGGLGWLSGFNELICRCGLISNGPPGKDPSGNPLESDLTLHGRIANTPACYVSVTLDPAEGGWIRLDGKVEEGMLFGSQLLLESTLEMQLGSNKFRIHDRVTNLGAENVESELLYHINVGAPFLEEGAAFAIPFAEMAPRDPRAAEDVNEFRSYLGPTAGYAEQAYYFDPVADENGFSPALLSSKTGKKGFLVNFRKSTLPCFTLWKNTQPEVSGYVTGLEPGINFPNFRADERERGRLKNLDPGDSYETEFEVSILNNSDSVDVVRQKITKLTEQAPSVIHSAPHARFS
ncbi:aldose 1-epimerase family protein [Gimesia sp.]|uniref:aldose 1-epimerase family protein n=1 Tax=Gimesia sp. TaxID=2024833 RepID=UPI003A941829